MPNSKRPDSLAALKRQRTKRLAKVGARAYYLSRRGRKQEMYDLICDEFVSLGGIYIKFLQGVLFNTEVVRRWRSPHKLRIFEDVDQEPMDIVAILHNELGPQRLQSINGVELRPFAAGSFGQVYLGQHQNGKRIIIKVLRPAVSELLKFDLRLLKLFSTRVTFQQTDNISVKMNEAFREFRQATLKETDYVAEASLANALYQHYYGHPHIVIPETYMDLCTTHIIVQEYIGGISGATLLKLKSQGGDPVSYVSEQLGSQLDTQLSILGIEYLTSAFELPRIQGDPHPGNVRFLPENKIGLIDFGVSATPPHNRAAFFGILEQWDILNNHTVDLGNLFEQYIRFFANDLYRALKLMSGFKPQQSQMTGNATDSKQGGDLVKELCRVAQEMLGSALSMDEIESIIEDGHVLTVFGQTINRGNRLGLVIRLESSELLRAWQTYVAMVAALGRRPQVLPGVFTEAVEYLRHNQGTAIHATERPMSITRAIDTINHWLERVAIRDPALFKELLSHIDARTSAIPKSEVIKEAPDNA